MSSSSSISSASSIPLLPLSLPDSLSLPPSLLPSPLSLALLDPLPSDTLPQRISEHVSEFWDAPLIHKDFTPVPKMFRFENSNDSQSLAELRKRCQIATSLIDGKPVVIIDGFFSKEEGEEFRNFIDVDPSPFSNKSYSTPQSKINGEPPCGSLTDDHHRLLMAHPLSSLNCLHRLLGQIGKEMDADLSTQPFILELQPTTRGKLRALTTNLVSYVSQEAQDLGWHTDYDPETKGLPYRIRSFDAKRYYPSRFTNGGAGNPLLISLILYIANNEFSPDLGMGTLMKDLKGRVTKIDCCPMRIVLFQGDILHTMETSSPTCPKDPSWKRLSYVMKLMARPKDPDSSAPLQQRFIELFTSPISSDPNTRSVSAQETPADTSREPNLFADIHK